MNPWLMALIVVAAANPVRRGVQLRPGAPAVVGVGAATAMAVLVASAGGASTLVSDVVQVAVPSFVVGAGLVVALAALVGLVRLARRAEREVPGLSASGAWAAPVAFPVLLAPPVVFGVVALGADHGIAVAVLTALAAVGSTVAVSRSRVGDRTLWGAATEVVALVGGLGMIASGVFAV